MRPAGHLAGDGRGKALVRSATEPPLLLAEDSLSKGRVSYFAASRNLGVGVYKLHFDMSRYSQAATATPFFPEIEVAFQVSDPRAHYHVPVVVSPYGYSTYRGN